MPSLSSHARMELWAWTTLRTVPSSGQYIWHGKPYYPLLLQATYSRSIEAGVVVHADPEGGTSQTKSSGRELRERTSLTSVVQCRHHRPDWTTCLWLTWDVIPPSHQKKKTRRLIDRWLAHALSMGLGVVYNCMLGLKSKPNQRYYWSVHVL